MGTTYAAYVTTMQTLLVVADPQGQANLNAILPDMIAYAELRCYRDLQLLNTVASGTGTVTAGLRTFTIPAPTSPADGDFVVVQSVNVYSPVGSTAANGLVNPCQRVSKEFLLAVFPDPTAQDVPSLYADVDNMTLLLGATPDANYLAQVYGTFRPAPLSVSNTTTVLTDLFQDLFVAASMVFGSGYQRDFSPAGSDPQMPVNWEQQYKTLLQGAEVEEALKQAQGAGWTAAPPAPAATPPRQ